MEKKLTERMDRLYAPSRVGTFFVQSCYVIQIVFLLYFDIFVFVYTVLLYTAKNEIVLQSRSLHF